MGAQSSNEGLLHNYIHPRLGKIKRIQQQEGKEFMEYVIFVENVQIFQKWEQQLRKIDNPICNEFVFIPIKSKFEKIGICGAGGNAIMKYGDFMFTLQPEIRNRAEIKRPFQQSEIWYMLYVLIKVQSIFERKQMKIGDVKPANILVNEQGELQIISQYSWPGQVDNFTISIDNQQEKVFLAPEECKTKRIKKDGSDFVSANKAQVFSIGLTILQAGTLMDCSELYTKKYHFNDHKLKDFTDVMEAKYSKLLNRILRLMLRVNPSSRKGAIQLEQHLCPFHEKILSLIELNQQDKQSLERSLFHEPIEKMLPRKISMKKMEQEPNYMSEISPNYVPIQERTPMPNPQQVYPSCMSLRNSNSFFPSNSNSFYTFYSRQSDYRPTTKVNFCSNDIYNH